MYIGTLAQEDRECDRPGMHAKSRELASIGMETRNSHLKSYSAYLWLIGKSQTWTNPASNTSQLYPQQGQGRSQKVYLIVSLRE